MAEVGAPHRNRAIEPRQVLVSGLEALEHPGQVVPLALQALTGAVDKQREVLARVAVKRGKHLVEVDLRIRVGQRDCVSRVDDRSGRGAGIELDEHVLQSRLWPEQRGGIGVDQVPVLGVDRHLHDRVAVLDADARERPDLHT